MKKIMLILSALLLVSIMGYTQEISPDKVPAPVKQAFTKKFPTATDVKYEMDKKNYDISFKDKDAEMSADFNAYGKWMETKTKMTETALPKKVMKSVTKNFAGYTMSEIATVETVAVKLCYEMVLKNDKLGYDVQFSPKGDILKKVPLKKSKVEIPGNEKK